MELNIPDGTKSAASPSRKSFLPRPRLKQNITGPAVVGQTTCGGLTRRKRSADQALFTDDASSLQVHKRVSRHRLLSSVDTAFEASCVRSAKPKTLSTRVIGHERTPLTALNRAGAASNTSKSNLCSAAPTSGSQPPQKENTYLQKPRHYIPSNRIISARTLRSASCILNVGLFNVATENATQPSAYLSLNPSDDISRWDMDSLPSIPSPPDSPESRTTSTAASPTIVRNPFSDPIDDEELVENEMPFLPNRHGKVVLEDMGIKKLKSATRNRSSPGVGGTILNRHVNTELASSSPPSVGLPGLPHPLPLRTLCQNTTAQYPLLNAHPQVSKTSPPKPSVSRGPSSSRKDSWGCIHLGASDCELSIAFKKTSHWEVWDMGDDGNIAIPVLLCIMAKDAQEWSGMPIALPDVSCMDIRCDDVPIPARFATYDPSQEYSAQYYGPCAASTCAKDGSDTSMDTPPAAMKPDSIMPERRWLRTYSRPDVAGRSHILRSREVADAYARAAGGTAFGALARGWYLQFWICVPTRLFATRETRIFRLQARVWMMGDENKVLSLDENENGKVVPLVADAHMTVSHLRTPREMDGAWGLR